MLWIHADNVLYGIAPTDDISLVSGVGVVRYRGEDWELILSYLYACPVCGKAFDSYDSADAEDAARYCPCDVRKSADKTDMWHDRRGSLDVVCINKGQVEMVFDRIVDSLMQGKSYPIPEQLDIDTKEYNKKRKKKRGKGGKK